MSAYADGRNSHVISLPGAANNPTHEAAEQFSSLPIVNELENYFRQSRQLEAKWAQERTDKRKVQQELKQTQTRYEQIVNELEVKLRNSADREEQFKAKIEEFKEKENHYKKIEATLLQEQDYRKKYQEYVKKLKTHYSEIYNQAQLRIQKLTHYAEHLKSKISLQMQNDRQAQEQIKSLNRQIESFKDGNKQADLDQELLKVKLQHAKQMEDSLRAAMHNTQHTEKSYMNQIEQLKTELADSKKATETAQRYADEMRKKFEEFRMSSDGSKASLYQYQQALREANHRLRQVYQSSNGWKKKLEELQEQLASERRKYDELEERMKKEKRDKQIALNCLHTAESRMANLAKVAEESKQNTPGHFYDRGLELGF